MEQPIAKMRVEEEYSIPPDAPEVELLAPSARASESFYSEPLTHAGAVLNHHPASPFARVAQRPGTQVECLAEVGETIVLSPRVQPVQTIGTAVAATPQQQVDAHLPLSEQPWFHGASVDRQAAERLLRPCPEGAFLVRRCRADADAGQQQQYSLSLRGRQDQQCVHMRIERTPLGHYVLGQYSQPFATVPLMIRHYTEHLLPIQDVDKLFLVTPVARKRRASARQTSGGGSDGAQQ